MKPKFANLILAASIVVSFSGQALAAPVIKANNADALNLNTSWVGGVLPGAADIATWDATITGVPVQTVALGADLSWSGIDMTNTGADVTFTAANTVTLGTAGFTSAATKWVFINSAVALGAAQTWTTPNNLYINGIVSGSSALTKAGGAILTLSGTNTITGGINVTAGQVTTKNGAGLGPVANVLTLGNGTTYRYERTGANGTTFVGNPITVSSSSSVTITGDNAANGYSGLVTGDAASTVNIGAVGALTQCSFSAAGQQFASFPGTVAITAAGSIRFSASSALNNGGSSTIFAVNGNLTTRNGGAIALGALTGAGTINAGGSGGNVTFTIGGKGINADFAGVISNNSATILSLVTKTGAGTQTLSGANTYTGNTAVNVGTLEIGNGGATGSIGATNVAVAALANFVLNPGSSQAQTVSGIISGAGNVVKRGGGRTTLTGVNTFSVTPVIEAGMLAINADSGLGNAANGVSFATGSGTLASDAAGLTTARAMSLASGITGGLSAIDATDSIEASGVISGNGALAIGGLGVVRLTGANTYVGTTTVTSGILDVGAAGSTSTGAVSVTGGNLAGTGTVTGAVSVSSGAGVKPGAVTTTTSATGTLNTGALTLAGGSTLYTEFTNAATYDRVVVTGNLLTSGASVATPVLVDLRLENSVAKWTTLGTYNLIQYSGTFTGNANDLFEVSPGSTQSGLSYTFAASGGFITVTVAGAAPSEWNVDANGTWTNAGNWLNGVPNAIGATAKFGPIITALRTVTVDSPKTVGTVQFNNANDYTVAGASILSLNATTGNAGIEILAGSHAITAPLSLDDSLDLTLASAANTLTLTGNITGAGGINNATSGAVTFSGTNTFAGAVSFSNGSLTFGNGSLGAGALTLANTTLHWDSGNVQDISTKTVTIGGTSVTFDTNFNNVLLANPIGNSGTGNLIKTGQGRLTFAGTATYTGTTTISGGILQLGNGGTNGLVSGTITNNVILAVNLVGGSVFPNLVVGTGSFVHAGSGSLSLSAQNTFSGTTSISANTGILSLADPLNLQNSTLNLAAAGGDLSFGTLTAATLGGLSGDKGLALNNTTPAAVTLTIGNNNQATTYSGVLSGTGSLTKVGTAVSSLSGLNSYSGATLVSGGNLELLTGGGINGSTLTVSGTGKMLISGGSFGATTGTLNIASNGLEINGGTVTFSGALTAAGSTGVSASALIKVTGGSLTVPSITLGRTFENATAEPAAATADRNLYITGGAVSITGALNVGTASAQPNSTVVTRIDGGSLTVDGALTVGLNNTGRWSILDNNGGVLTSTNAVSGIVLGGTFGTGGKSAFLVRAGIATAERIQLGQLAMFGNGLVNVSGGELYVGAGGIVVGSTEAAFVPEIRLSGGTLGAKAAWSTSVPVNVTTASTIKASNALDAAQNITLNGPVTGAGGLTKVGDGTLTMTNGNSYLGITAVYKGTLSVTTKTFDDATTIALEPANGAVLNLNFSGGDRIAVLTIDSVGMPDGVYGSLTNSTPGITQTAAITGTGLLYVNTAVPTSPYLSWAAANGLTTGVNDGAGQDPDNDGVSNMLEFVLGGNPLASSTGILPALTMTPTNFIFNFTRSDESEAEVALTFQSGTNLSSWAGVAVGAVSAGVVTIVENGSAPDSITVTIPKGSNTKLFGRLQGVK